MMRLSTLASCLLSALLLAVSACGGPRLGRSSGASDGAPCMRLQGERQVRGEVLCEDVWTCFRQPAGLYNRIGLRRLALCQGATGPVVFYLPGMHQNGEIAGNEARYDLRLYLAQAGFRTWSLDYRTHAVPPDAPPDALQVLAGWDARTFAEDAAWGISFARGADTGPLFLAGFSYGARVAYTLASGGDLALSGLVILDGTPGDGRTPPGNDPVIDVAGGRLPWPERERLLAAVMASPSNPSPIAGYTTAGRALADILFTAPSFGGNGALSAARDGVSDIQVVARLLASYDRWWPRAALGGAAASAPRQKLPVLAFAAENMGPEWVSRVQEGAKAFAGERARVVDMPLHGHLDVLVGRLAASEVFEPARRWMLAPP